MCSTVLHLGPPSSSENRTDELDLILHCGEPVPGVYYTPACDGEWHAHSQSAVESVVAALNSDPGDPDLYESVIELSRTAPSFANSFGMTPFIKISVTKRKPSDPNLF